MSLKILSPIFAVMVNEIPTFEGTMLPLLETLKDGKERPLSSLIKVLAEYFQLTEHQLHEIITEGGDKIFQSRVDDARRHLKKADLIDETGDKLVITSLGKQILQRKLNQIDVEYLRRLPGYLE